MSMSPLIYNCSYLWKIHTTIPNASGGTHSALRVEPMPADTNQSGEVFGGWVMSQVDLAGANTAMRYALSRYIVTRAVSSLTFEAPVLVGDVVSFIRRLSRWGGTSVTVKVEVYAERLTKLCNNIAKITEAELVYVAHGGGSRSRLPWKSPAAQFAAVLLPLKRGTAFLVPNRGGGRVPARQAAFFPACG